MKYTAFCLVTFLIISCQLSLSAQISFQPYHTFVTGAPATALVISDINSDGRSDVAVITGTLSEDTTAYRLLIYLQTADGNLANPVTYYYPARQYSDGAISLDAGDLNGDGMVDIAIASDDNLVIFYQQPGGTFTRAITYIGYGTDAVKIGDLNHDGRMDVAITQFNETTIHIFYQDASGNLDKVDYASAKCGYVKLVITDLNNDSLDDLLLYSYGGYEHGLFYYLQNADGSLAYPYSSGIGQTWSNGMAVGNLNNDSKPDFAISGGGNYPAKLELYMQQQNGFGFNPPVTLTAYDIPTQVCIDDLNCDGRNEIMLAHMGWSAISIFEQDETNNYSTYSLIGNTYGNNYMYSMSTGDLNGDHRPDIAVASGHLIIHYNTTKPPVSDSLIVRRPSFNDPSYRDYKIFSRHTDTISPHLYVTSDTLNVQYTVNHATGYVDTYAIRIGTVCGNYMNDTTLLGTVYTNWSDTLSIDTTVLYHHVDTLDYHGIEDSDLARNILIYPNPSHGIVHLETNNLNSTVEITVYDAQGTKCNEFEAAGRSGCLIDLTAKPKGVYLVKCSMGKRIVCKRILLN